MQIIVNLLRGFAIGVANIIPGVSGGTVALMLGIYQRLLNAIGALGSETLKALISGKTAIIAELKRTDAAFLISLAVGAGAPVWIRAVFLISLWAAVLSTVQSGVGYVIAAVRMTQSPKAE